MLQVRSYQLREWWPSNGSRINIQASDNYRLYILFTRDNSGTLPSSQFANKVGVAYEYAFRFPYYVDLLRNEGPIWITFNTDAPSFVVYAASEPVGEGES